jgi:hypothetical protein
MLLGRQDAEAMQLVVRMQVPKSGLLWIDPDRPEPGLDSLQEVGTAVIALNQRLHGGHARVLTRVSSAASGTASITLSAWYERRKEIIDLR